MNINIIIIPHFLVPEKLLLAYEFRSIETVSNLVLPDFTVDTTVVKSLYDTVLDFSFSTSTITNRSVTIPHVNN